MRKTKIICTLGPSTDKGDVLEQLMLSGMNVARLNFSHDTYENQKKRIDKVKALRTKHNLPVACLLDTKGPEIRTELFEGDAKEYSYKTGEKIRVATKQGIKSTREVIALNVAGALDIYDDVEVGMSMPSIKISPFWNS